MGVLDVLVDGGGDAYVCVVGLEWVDLCFAFVVVLCVVVLRALASVACALPLSL